MTKKDLVKAIMNFEYTKKEREIKGLLKSRADDLMRMRKADLERRLAYLEGKVA